MKDVTVEILLATYNGEAYIRAQIDSILAQSDDRWHLTVSDDGSIDRTSEIMDEYISCYPDRIARVSSGKRFGNARDHFFWMIGQCSAEYIATCDQDDYWYCDKVKKQLDILMEAEAQYGAEMPLLVFSDQTPTDAQLRPLAPSLMRYQNQYFEHFDYRSILMQNVVTGGAMVFNHALADLAMKCVDPSQTIMHDWWMAVVAARFGKIIYIDEPLSDYRQHGTNSVGAKDVRSLCYVAEKAGMLSKVRDGIVRKKQQADIFLKTYIAQLRETDRVFIRRFSVQHSGFRFYFEHRKLFHSFYRWIGFFFLG